MKSVTKDQLPKVVMRTRFSGPKGGGRVWGWGRFSCASRCFRQTMVSYNMLIHIVYMYMYNKPVFLGQLLFFLCLLLVLFLWPSRGLFCTDGLICCIIADKANHVKTKFQSQRSESARDHNLLMLKYILLCRIMRTSHHCTYWHYTHTNNWIFSIH